MHPFGDEGRSAFMHASRNRGYGLPATFNIRIGIHYDTQGVLTRDLRFGPDIFQKRIDAVRNFNLELRHGSMAFAYVFDNMIIGTAFHQ